ncbi:MAG: phosphatase PAP2 family protein [Miltoncostaeaceae bacterium]
MWLGLSVAGTRRRLVGRRNAGRGGLAAQAGLIAFAALAYFGVRGLTRSEHAVAAQNAEMLVTAQSRLSLDLEPAVQRTVIDHDWLVTVANWIYIFGHWPLIAAVLTWLYLVARPDFRILRDAMFISGAIGLVIFALFPVAPPRLGVLEVVDTVSERSMTYRALQPPSLTNPYAALPSLHVGWNLLLGIMIWRVGASPLLRVFAVVMPALMVFAVVATANHYVVDVLAGAVVALVGLALARRLRDRRAGMSVPSSVVSR